MARSIKNVLKQAFDLHLLSQLDHVPDADLTTRLGLLSVLADEGNQMLAPAGHVRDENEYDYPASCHRGLPSSRDTKRPALERVSA